MYNCCHVKVYTKYIYHLAEVEEHIVRSTALLYLQPHLIGPVIVNGLQTLGMGLI